MAKNSVPRSGGTSKVRIVVIDAELQEGEIGQLAQAIQGAFGGQRNAIRANGPAVRSLSPPELAGLPAEENDAEVADPAETEAMAPAPSRPRTPKKLRSPSLDPELNPGTEPSFKAYAEARNVTAATSVLMKFLTIAAWLFEERAEVKINADRAFTCFRFMEWPFHVDFYQPLFDLRSKRDFLDLKPWRQRERRVYDYASGSSSSR